MDCNTVGISTLAGSRGILHGLCIENRSGIELQQKSDNRSHSMRTNIAGLPAHFRILVMLQSALNIGVAMLSPLLIILFSSVFVYCSREPISDSTLLIVIGLPSALILMILYASHCLLVQRHYVFCVVCASIECLTIIGTIPGGIMLFLLFSPSIKALFKRNMQNED